MPFEINLHLYKNHSIMKKSLFFSVFLAFLAECLPAQSGQFVQAPIIVQSGNMATATSTLDSALLIAQNGDLIYLPGGNFVLNAPINKPVHIYGTGWRSDSAAVTGSTRIFPGVTLNAGASGGSINGVYVQGSIYNDNPQNVALYTISRCYAVALDFRNEFYTEGNLTINSSVFDWIRGQGIINLNNSIVITTLRGFGGNPVLNINHCFLAHFNQTNNKLFEFFHFISMSNSIVFHNSTVEGNFWNSPLSDLTQNNLFVGNPAGLPTWLSTYATVRDLGFRSSVFTNYTGALYFTEASDVHPKPTCTECAGKGIYAGPTPYRDVPENPYVTARSVNISPNGQQLLLNFTVNKGAN